MITLFRTSDAARYLGISNNYLKNLRESHGGFLIEGEDYFLGVSVTDSIRWDVDKIRKKMHDQGRIIRYGRTVSDQLAKEA
tara:strand:- start:2880 stop:3122 length:243 start_codon:yes stop_codon:yes gene_type:complete